MKIPKKGPVVCECQEDEDEVYYQNDTTKNRVKIIYKHWKGNHSSRFPICRQEFLKLCQLLPRAKELADRFAVSEETLTRWAEETFRNHKFKTIADLIAQLGSQFILKLRQLLHEHAAKSPQASIFLAKNYLGMRDQLPEETQDISVETINYNLQSGKAIGLWNKAKRAKKSLPKGEFSE